RSRRHSARERRPRGDGRGRAARARRGVRSRVGRPARPRQGVRARHPALQHRHERARAARHPARVVAEAVLSHASPATTAPPHPPARTLAWIIAFKFFKSLTLAALGVTLLAVRRSDPVDLLIRLALVVHLPLASRLLDRALSAASSLTVARET